MSSPFKRRRSTSPTSSDSRSPSPATKHTRMAAKSTPLICNLPPTCSHPNKPTELSNSRDLETHYARYHAHVCEHQRCGCVFPDEHFLELHLRECHDPLTDVRRDRGEKTFACFQVTCNRLFQTPKSRRMHLIEAHAYPKEYFFAVTRGEVLQKWGEGVSLLRGNWKQRDGTQQSEEDADDVVIAIDQGAKASPAAGLHPTSKEKDRSESKTEDKAVQGPKTTNPVSQGVDASDIAGDQGSRGDTRVKASRGRGGGRGGNVDSLVSSMDALSLVPPSVKFGRGAASVGFVGHASNSRDKEKPEQGAPVDSHVAHRGRGAPRGAGQIGFVAAPRGGSIRGVRGSAVRGARGAHDGGPGSGRGVPTGPLFVPPAVARGRGRGARGSRGRGSSVTVGSDPTPMEE